MIDIEPLSPKAHRIAIYGEFGPEDVRKFVAFAQSHLDAGGGGNILIDMVFLAGFSWSALAGEVGHVPMLMRWLYSLDRIALVSDEDWIRSMARLESALLPGVTYEVYDADEAEAARAWVLEHSDRAHDGAVVQRDEGPDIAAYEIAGRLDRDEAERAIDQVRAHLAANGANRLMVVIRNWHGFDPDAALSAKVVQGNLDILGQIDRYAVVGGPGWLRQVASATSPLVNPEVRGFDESEEAAALAWLRGDAQPSAAP